MNKTSIIEINHHNIPENIALIYEDDEQIALKKLFKLAHDESSVTNSVIWVNSNQRFSKNEQSSFAEICDLNNVNTARKKINNYKQGPALKTLFNYLADYSSYGMGLKGYEISQDLEPLEFHLNQRVSALKKAFPDRDVYLTLRSEVRRTAQKYTGNPHIDGGSDREERFIETLYGRGTCLYDNQDVEFDPSFDKVKLKNKEANLYQVPNGSLTILTSHRNTKKPVMHTAPPIDIEENRDFRIVAIYDLKKKSRNFFTQLASKIP